MDFYFFYNQNIFLCPSYKEDWKIIAESFQELCKNCTLQKIEEETKYELNEKLGSFDFLETFEPIYFIDAVQISSNAFSFYLCLLSVNSDSKGPVGGLQEQSQVRYEVVAILNLKKKYGHVLMRPEVFSDKLSEIFRKIEIDFDLEPEFSKNYFVISEEEDRFTNTVSRKMLHTIGEHKGLFIEISEDQMLINFKKGLSKESIVSLADISIKILQSE